MARQSAARQRRRVAAAVVTACAAWVCLFASERAHGTRDHRDRARSRIFAGRGSDYCRCGFCHAWSWTPRLAHRNGGYSGPRGARRAVVRMVKRDREATALALRFISKETKKAGQRLCSTGDDRLSNLFAPRRSSALPVGPGLEFGRYHLRSCKRLRQATQANGSSR